MQSADNSLLTALGNRLVSESLSDTTLLRAAEDTPDFAILPWVNVCKLGGQSIMDRGRSAVMPLSDEIVANLTRHKMILGTGAGTRARHIYSLAIDLGMPVGVLTVLGTAVAWQNAQMLQYLLARHGIAFLEPEAFASLPHYLMERGAGICQGMPPYKLWEENPAASRIPPQRTYTGRPATDARVARRQAGNRRRRGAGTRHPAKAQRHSNRRPVDHGPRQQRRDAAARRDRGQPGRASAGGRGRSRRAGTAYLRGRLGSRLADRGVGDVGGKIGGAERLYGLLS